MKLSKSIIIFDGSNFYHKLKDAGFPHPSRFDYQAFSKHLTSKSKLVSKYYCIGKIRAKQEDKKARLLMAKQQKFITKLSQQGFTIQFGYLLKTDKQFHEKGVDVQIAVNILKGAYRNIYDLVYLVSSDSDLLPAILEAQSNGKIVVYVGFKDKLSYALKNSCKKSVILTKDDFHKFSEKTPI
ncbi:hypothetical protein A2781_02370 [Candidatus Gottesmanbacteria bacterium RIFCSPHIGHO2_01_FULL_42_27]|uniref:NYN domain-containing protein n=2 Tax=Candidatus Gottesmaniibacteriota TaxID=1752720 RepID=A0A0G1HKV2_9BACT|nr:MAG: hypothetical protein UV46_C0071G0004 [Candidatus Gottesmanbacteria bacterium GW2011_GWC2_42_8]KKT47550.1 MAG: hypothetical protein UW37_C0006G0013 [Candidatus Gottesmanbacteria bacterium GW2011_GWA2_44_17]OGG12260.1 MAG: hypothetical protein A2781_02370 [Candidatus Gottesmanbacteria bacterium RIFCSPHIGHO2_01_FULL_42_27]OGG22422.1 MAG: hypothetical protein A3E72_01045 [Candidatus Gottesmanbacteria bacterium RIFCSPHIGHO2_12_FULL_43_26]OGG32993.1 MAG: hypothetical protein A3G68_06910 [Cand